MPEDDELDAYYLEDAYYGDKTPFSKAFHSFSYQLASSRLRLIAQYRPLSRGQRWLDVGAGNAVLGYALKQMQPDTSYDALEPSNSIRQDWGDWVSVVFDDLSAAPLETYDVITLNHVLEHVNHPLPFLKNIAKYLVRGGLVYIDVPHRDDLFKENIEPHLLFWEKDSLTFTVEKAGLVPLFCDTAGMKWRRARNYFNPALIDKIIDPWRWVARANNVLSKAGIENSINTFPQFQADRYGGDRQWLRCIAKKLA